MFRDLVRTLEEESPFNIRSDSLMEGIVVAREDQGREEMNKFIIQNFTEQSVESQ